MPESGVRECSRLPLLLTPVYIAFLTIVVVSFFRLLVYGAHAQALLSELRLHTSRVRQGISSEELLIYTHLAIVSGIFLPYLLVRGDAELRVRCELRSPGCESAERSCWTVDFPD